MVCTYPHFFTRQPRNWLNARGIYIVSITVITLIPFPSTTIIEFYHFLEKKCCLNSPKNYWQNHNSCISLINLLNGNASTEDETERSYSNHDPNQLFTLAISLAFIYSPVSIVEDILRIQNQWHVKWDHMADFRCAPSQWETALLYNDVSRWLGASLKSALTLSRVKSPVIDTSFDIKNIWHNADHLSSSLDR